jgi:D-amino-acid oxidase
MVFAGLAFGGLLRLRFICLLFFTVVVISLYSKCILAEIRNVKPPKLGSSHLGKRILCHRPMRRNSPRLDIQKFENKIVVNNYGHGGSGWTLGPGSARYIVNLLQSEIKNEPKNIPIAVIGAGAIGLFSTLELLDRGFTNITIIAEKFSELPSHNAGGLFAPVSMDNDPEVEPFIHSLGIESYNYFNKIAQGRNPIFKSHGCRQRCSFRFRERNPKKNGRIRR